MDKVYLVVSIPDYIGCDIEFVFDNEEAAESCAAHHNATAPRYDQWFVEAHSIFSAFRKENEDGKSKENV